MTPATPGLAEAFAGVLAARRSTRTLAHGPLPDGLLRDLASAAGRVPSAFDAQPWQVVALHERNAAFWDEVEEAITARLVDDRRERYLRRASGFRGGVLTLLVFEDLTRSIPRDGLTEAEARDQASQGLGMLQLALWLSLTSHGLAASLQHWHAFIEDVALSFCGLPPTGYRLVAFIPAGYAIDRPVERIDRPGKLALERYA